MAAPRPLVAGNWKMNGLKASLGELEAIRDAVKAGGAGRAEAALCPPFTLVAAVAAAAEGSPLAIGAQETVALWSEGSAEPCANRTACLEFQVEDVDADYARLKDRVSLVHELKMMPWGNRTFQFRDPEGTAVSLYMPATEAAKARFAAR